MSSVAGRPNIESLLQDAVARGEDDGSSVVGRIASVQEPKVEDFYAQEGSESPGRFPFSRGRTCRGYLDEYWVMGQYSGFATPKQTNQRFRDLLAAGQTGLSVALDLPTQLGYDSDAPLAHGEVGKVGVPLDTIEDMLVLFDGVPLDQVKQIRTTANAIAPIFIAVFLEALVELDVDPKGFRIILQNDPLKEYIARGTYIFPPAASLKLAVDVVEYFAEKLPHWEPIEFCGYHIRDAGGNAVHEVAIATVNGLAYLDAAAARGVSIDEIAHSLFLFLSAGIDIFAEAAKLRAARRLWARILVDRYGVHPDRAAINLFVYTLGGLLTAQEAENNIMRVTCEGLAAVLGGVQTLATSSFDEALGLPSDRAARLALRTQQVIAYESGATRVVDPLGGSYYIEALTDALEAAIVEQVVAIAGAGGAVAAIESGSLHRLLADAAWDVQLAIENGERPVVGVNVHATEELPGVHRVFSVNRELESEQVDNLRRSKAGRHEGVVATALAGVTAAAAADENVIPALRQAARARATMGEMTSALEAQYGRFSPSQTY
jgi:methylmalonyl-CoA mutase N-terminal domain/subunit